MTNLSRDVTTKPGDTPVATDLGGKTYCQIAIESNEPTDTLLGKVCAAGKLVVATDPAYPPYSSLDASGEYVGFDSDTAREVAKRLGVTIEWATPDWSAITAGSWGGRWDISIGSMTQTEERAQVVDFVAPYFYESGYIVVAAE
jgi:polar amino acid transport system substrate-binding protein